MGKAYSLDLRERVIKEYIACGSSLKVGIKYQVSHDFVSELVNKYKETGSLLPKKHGGNHKPKILGEDLVWLKNKLLEKNDLLIREIIELLYIERGLKVSLTSVRTAFKTLNFSVKKRHFMPMKEKATKYN